MSGKISLSWYDYALLFHAILMLREGLPSLRASEHPGASTATQSANFNFC